jgi:ATP-dependent Clp protease ATP-binding subunit ClpA
MADSAIVLGVIFLTTNQLTQFDPAFESRIHFKLFYEPLTSKQRAMIWKHLLPPRKSGNASQLRQPEQDDWSEDCLLRLGSQYNVNGREIRNMIKNALALAHMQNEELDEKHLHIMSEINHVWNTKVRAA